MVTNPPSQQRHFSASGGPFNITTNQPTDIAILAVPAVALGQSVDLTFIGILTVGVGSTGITITLAVHNADGSGGGTIQASAVPVLAGEAGSQKILAYKATYVATQIWAPASFRVAVTQTAATGNGSMLLSALSADVQ